MIHQREREIGDFEYIVRQFSPGTLITIEITEVQKARHPECVEITPNIGTMRYFCNYRFADRWLCESNSIMSAGGDLINGRFKPFWPTTLWLWAGLIPRIEHIERQCSVEVFRHHNHLLHRIYKSKDDINGIRDELQREGIETSFESQYVSHLRSSEERIFARLEAKTTLS